MGAWQRLFRKKPIEVIDAEEHHGVLERQLELFDLVCIGLGTTVGTGIFATAGSIIYHTAGPAGALSWMIAGLGTAISAFAYMELTSRIPSSGSSYAFTYHTFGELPAFIISWLLTLAYALSASGIARSWADKVYDWAVEIDPHKDHTWMNEENYNLLGSAVLAFGVTILLCGLKLGKTFINTITVLKVGIVLFMVIMGFAVSKADNYTPFFRSEEWDATAKANKYGFQGIMIGATKAFFGYIGFDEVCCLAAESKNPRTVMPRAVLLVVLGTCAMSILASLALAGILPCDERIIGEVGFAMAFKREGYHWARLICRIGEAITMPVVVLAAFLAQPRLQCAMSLDGLLPPIFSQVDSKGNLFWNTLITGIIFTMISFFVPFEPLWHLIDFGVLFSFSITNLALLKMRYVHNVTLKSNIDYILAVFFLSTGAAVFLLQRGVLESESDHVQMGAGISAGVFAVVSLLTFIHLCLREQPGKLVNSTMFSSPLVPFTPCLAVLINWYLMAQTKDLDILYACAWTLGAIPLYFAYGYSHSVGNKNQWAELLGKAALFTPEVLYQSKL